MIYEFWWSEGSFLMDIDADKKTVEELLDEYRASDEYYNDIDWRDFLVKRGIKARFLEPEEKLYF